MRRRTGVLLAATVLVLGAATYGLQPGDDVSAEAVPTVDEGIPGACVLLVRVEEQVQRNASASSVLLTLNAAIGKARAVEGAPQGIALLGGLQAVRVGLEHDDAAATRVGIDAARAQCRLTR